MTSFTSDNRIQPPHQLRSRQSHFRELGTGGLAAAGATHSLAMSRRPVGELGPGGGGARGRSLGLSWAGQGGPGQARGAGPRPRRGRRWATAVRARAPGSSPDRVSGILHTPVFPFLYQYPFFCKDCTGVVHPVHEPGTAGARTPEEEAAGGARHSPSSISWPGDPDLAAIFLTLISWYPHVRITGSTVGKRERERERERESYTFPATQS